TGSGTHDVTFVEGDSYQRLVARDGKPLSPKEEGQEEKKLRQTAEERREARHSGRAISFGVSSDDVAKLCDHRLLGEEELHAHKALLREEFERKGLPPEEARRAARRAYGGVEQSKELHREARSFVWIEQLVKDLRYSARNLLRTPGFTLIAVTVLALGIGVNA